MPPLSRLRLPKLSLWIVLPALLLILGALCLARAYAGLFGLTAFAADAFTLLDAGWRVLQGQRPYLDFFTSLGPFCYMPTALGLWLSHGNAEGLVYGQIAVGLLAAIWVFFLARSRFHAAVACLLSVYVLLLTVAPFTFGSYPFALNPAMTYNRTGYAFLVLVLIEMTSPPSSAPRSGLAGGLSTGAILGILLFTKVTYFFGGILLLAALLPMRRQTTARLAGIAAGFFGITLCWCAYADFNIRLLIHDFGLMMAAKHIGFGRISFMVVELVSAETFTFILLFALGLALLWKELPARRVRSLILAGFAILVTQFFILFGNFQERGLPLNFPLALIVAGELIARFRIQPVAERVLRGIVISWALLLAIEPIAASMVGIAYEIGLRHDPTVAPFTSPNLRDVHTRELDYVGFVNEGMDLAARYRRPEDTIISLAFSDFFTYGFRGRPAKGGTTVLHFQTTFSDRAHLPPERLFGNVDIVMRPILPLDINTGPITRIYGPYLASHFHLEGQSPQWQLYRRN